MKRLLIISAFPVLLNGCGLAVDRDVRAYHTCLYRHPQNAVVCDGPRQAYEVDPSIVQARSPVGGPSGGVLPFARTSVASSKPKTDSSDPNR